MNNKFLLSLVLCVIVAGGLGFYAGTVYEQKQPRPSSRTAFGNPSMMRGQQGATDRTRANGGFVTGEVVSHDGTSITLKLPDGGSKIIFTSTSTRVGRMADANLTDLTTGTTVLVTGTANQDGSTTASNIQIRRPEDDALLMRGRGMRNPAESWNP